MRAIKVTMKDVAKEAHVTVGAVSAILRGSRDRIFYSDETRDRVLAVVDRLGYRVNPTARSLREGKTRTIGVMLDDITLPFLASLICATGKALEPHGYAILLCSVDATHAAREPLLRVFARGQIDTLLLAGALTSLTDADIVDITNRGHRVILLEREAPSPAIASVGVDNRAGGVLAVEHLLERGCRRLVILGGPVGNPMARQRIQGAQAACRKAGLPNANITLLETGGWTPEFGHASLRSHLVADRQPDAVFACNDLLAMGALWALNEKHLSIPKNVAVVGFDDSPVAAFTQPALTTIRQPVMAMGSAAAELCLDTLADPATCHRLFRPELIVRQSA